MLNSQPAAWQKDFSAKSQMIGYGLLELITVLALLIILTAAAVPTFIDLYQRYHLKTTVQNLNYSLQLAKSEAIKNNITVYVVFQTGDNWCYGINPSSSCNCAIANSCTLGRFVTTKTADLTLSSTGITGNSIQFEGTNGSTLTTGTLLFTIYGQSLSMGVKVNPLGNTNTCSSTISGYAAC